MRGGKEGEREERGRKEIERDKCKKGSVLCGYSNISLPHSSIISILSLHTSGCQTHSTYYNTLHISLYIMVGTYSF